MACVKTWRCFPWFLPWMITQSSEACIVYAKPTKELVHHKTGNDAPIYIVFPLQYFDFHSQHPGLSPVIQILFFSFKLAGIDAIDQVSKCMLPLQIKVRQAVSPIQRPELWVVQGRSGPLIKVLHWQASLKAIIVKCVKYEKQFANLLCSLYTLPC